MVEHGLEARGTHGQDGRAALVGKNCRRWVYVTLGIIQILQIYATYQGFTGGTTRIFYIVPLGFMILMLYLGLKDSMGVWLEEPTEGRYSDYRIDPKYIDGLGEKNREKHMKKYSKLLEKKN